MIRIVILEDDLQQAEHLISLINEYHRAHAGTSFDVVHYSSGAELLAAYHSNADLILMDIQMEGINGIETARKIRKTDEQAIIIFITSIAGYAVDGYSVNAYDYILKPLGYPMFEAKLGRVLRLLTERKKETIVTINTKTEFIRLSADKIMYIEVSDHDVLVHTEEKLYRHWGTLADYEAQLPAKDFVRCNACYLVNLRYVRMVHGSTVLVGDDELAISRSRHKDFLVALAASNGRD